MKLTSQASQIWTNLVRLREQCRQRPIDTCPSLKDELKGKYIPPSYEAHLLDQWHRFTQGNKSAKEYIDEFDKFLIRYGTLGEERVGQVMSRF